MLEKIHFDSKDCIDILNAIHGYLVAYKHIRKFHPDANFKPSEIKRAKDLHVLFEQIQKGGTFAPNYKSAKHIVFALAITKSAAFHSMTKVEQIHWNLVESKMSLICLYSAPTIKDKTFFINNLINHHVEEI